MEKWHLTLWTVVEEAMPEGSTQAKAPNSVISVPTTAVRGNIQNLPADSGDMWIVLARPGKRGVGSIELPDVSASSYQRLLAA
jgi:hypothetical protein